MDDKDYVFLGIDVGGTNIKGILRSLNGATVGRPVSETTGNTAGRIISNISSIKDKIMSLEEVKGDQKSRIDENFEIVGTGIALPGVEGPDGTFFAINADLNKPGFKKDLTEKIGNFVQINDANAFLTGELSWRKPQSHVAAIVFGTGLGGAYAIDGKIVHGADGHLGEFGHIPAPRSVLEKYDLELTSCDGCGRYDCYEDLISARNLSTLAKRLGYPECSSKDVTENRRGELIGVWAAWCEITAHLVWNVALTLNPKTIFLGGGLSELSGIDKDIMKACKDQVFSENFHIPSIQRGEGGRFGGAIGAAEEAILDFKEQNSRL